MFGGLSDPIAVQKLVRHFAQNTGVTVRLDYTDMATPHTAQAQDGTVTVVIPAWIKASDLPRMLAACLHESGHVEFDREGMAELNKALRNASLPSWAGYLHNVVTDARIDARRCDAFAGARSLYGETWAYSDAMQREAAGKRKAKDDEALRVHLTCLGGLAAALGFDADAPWIAAGPFAAHPKRQEIIDLLKGCAGRDDTLLPEALRLLALLALDPSLPPSPAPGTTKPGQGAPQLGEGAAGGGTGAPGDNPASGGGASPADPDTAALEAFDGETARVVKGRGIKTALRDPAFRDHLRVAANRVFRGQNIREPAKGGETGHIFHTSPATFGNAITPFSKAELVRARGEFIGDAIQAFVESTRDTLGDDDYRYRVAVERLPQIVSDPLSILIGDTVRPAPNCTVDILLDVSGSMQQAMTGSGGGRANTRMGALLHALDLWIGGAEAAGASGVRVGIRLFATDTGRHLDFTELSGVEARHLTGKAIEATSAARGCGGGTNARLGLEASIRDLQGEPSRRRAVLLITDGAIHQEDFDWMAREWPDGVALACLAVSEDAGGLFGGDNEVFRFRALRVEEVGPMLASAMRDSVERQVGRA